MTDAAPERATTAELIRKLQHLDPDGTTTVWVPSEFRWDPANHARVDRTDPADPVILLSGVDYEP